MGLYKLEVKSNGKLIKSTEINIFDVPDPEKTTISGLDVEMVSGDDVNFTITSKSKDGKIRTDCEDLFDIRIESNDNLSNKFKISTKNDGKYNINFVPQQSGMHKISIVSGGNLIKGKVYEINVKSGCNPFKSYAQGLGTKEAKVGGVAKFFIHSVDKSGRPRIFDDNFEILFDGPSDVFPLIKSNKNGSYLVEYSVNTTGKYLMEVKSNNCHIMESPFLVEVSEGADPLKCVAYGDGLVFANSGETSSFKIELNNDFNDVVDVEMNGDFSCKPKILNKGDGVYEVE
jgi:hypothetical protein